MDFFPAIDLKDGACVRLKQGDFAAATRYSDDPLAMAAQFEAAGARWLHLVDLDGAKESDKRQTALIEQIVKKTNLAVQTGGGIRTEEDIAALLAVGVRRVVIGSQAVLAPGLVWQWLKKFGGEHFVLALDVRLDAEERPEVLIRGWQEGSGASLWAVLQTYEGSGLQSVLCTDVTRDGMQTGPNVALYDSMRARQPGLALLASGGVGSLDDLRVLTDKGLAGAVVGKALYEGVFSVNEALAVCRGGRDAG